MTWTAIVNTGAGGSSSGTFPVYCSDGNMWWISINGSDGSVTVSSVKTSGVVNNTHISGGANSWSNVTNLATDGTYVYSHFKNNYPRISFYSVAISGYAVGSNGPYSVQFSQVGAVKTGSTVTTTGGNYAFTAPTAYEWNIPGLTPDTAIQYSGSAELGFNIYNGTYVFSNEVGTSTLFRILPSSLASTTYTLPTTTPSVPAQIGYDGSNLYIPASGGGIIVWNIAGASGSTYGSTVCTHCYYSTNFSLVLCSDSSGNTYTMPAGGGVLTNIGNLSTLSGTSQILSGFGDGASGYVWATGYVSYGSQWAFYYTAAAPATTQIVMIT